MSQQAKNRRRKFLEYQLQRLQQRYTKIVVKQERNAEVKRLRRLELKSKENVILKSLLQTVITARGNSSAKTNKADMSDDIDYKESDSSGILAANPNPQADAAIESIKAKFKAGLSFTEIALEAKQAPSFNVNDLLKSDEEMEDSAL